MDMLVKLYALPPFTNVQKKIHGNGINIRRAMAYERGKVCRWVERIFNPLWSDECATAFGRQPLGCYVAIKEESIIGFCCIEVTYQNFIGPIGVKANHQGEGVGKGLLLAAASDLYAFGYAYAIIGDVGAPEFFERSLGAIEIPDSSPGAYPPKIGNSQGVF